MIRNETAAVFADLADISKDRHERLETAGIFCGVIQRRVRGQKALDPEPKARHRLCAMCRAMVEHPLAWLKRHGGFRKTRYRGLTRNALDPDEKNRKGIGTFCFALGAVAIHFHRRLSIQA